MGLYKILVVDDDVEFIAPVTAILTGAGYEVSSAKDGWEGLSQARRTKPDLVLLDLRMPAMDGWTFMKFVRAHRDIAQIPVIFLTASTDPEDRERGRRMGADGYLVKGVDADQLLGEIAAVLDRRGLQSRSASASEAGAASGGTRLRMSGRI